jgi:hypothetical protein
LLGEDLRDLALSAPRRAALFPPTIAALTLVAGRADRETVVVGSMARNPCVR